MKYIFVLVVLLSGCTIISHKPTPDDWPQLKVTEVSHASSWSVIRHCYQYTPMWARLMLGFNVACAEIDFRSMTCTVHAAPGDDTNREHELDHCAGKDHVGASTLRDVWQGWKAEMTRGGVTYFYVRHDGKVVGITQ
jgi:hypothetical protein